MIKVGDGLRTDISIALTILKAVDAGQPRRSGLSKWWSGYPSQYSYFFDKDGKPLRSAKEYKLLEALPAVLSSDETVSVVVVACEIRNPTFYVSGFGQEYGVLVLTDQRLIFRGIKGGSTRIRLDSLQRVRSEGPHNHDPYKINGGSSQFFCLANGIEYWYCTFLPNVAGWIARIINDRI